MKVAEQDRLFIPKRFPASAADYFIYLTHVISDIEFRNIFRFDGQIDAARMERAIRLTLDAEPVLGCRFRRIKTRIFWERMPDLDSMSLCPIVEKQHFEVELHRFLADPLDSTVGPQVEARLFRSDNDTLSIKFSHVAGDGASHMEYLSLLAKTYRELGKNPDYAPLPNTEADRGMNQVLRNISIRSLARGFRGLFQKKPANMVFPATGQDPAEKRFTIRRLSPERLAKIKAYSRHHQASTYDILLTATYRALAWILAPEASPGSLIRPPIQVTVSLRRHLPTGQANTLCNLSAIFFPEVVIRSGESFEESLAKVHTMMTAAKSDQPWLGSLAYIAAVHLYRYPVARHILRALMRRRIGKNSAGSLTFSNIGALEKEQLSFGDVPLKEFISFGITQHLPGCLLGINGFDNELFFTMGYSSVNGTAIMEDFLNRVITELPG